MSNGGFNKDGTYNKEDRVDPFYRDPEYHLPIRYNSEGHIRAAIILVGQENPDPGFTAAASVHAQLAVASALQELRAEMQGLVGILRVDMDRLFKNDK